MIAASAAFAFSAPLAAPALAQIASTNVSFPRGATGTTINASIKGGQTRDYVLRARAGQVLAVRLDGSPNAYFNVLPPAGNDYAIHTGSSDGNVFSGSLSATGSYTIRVYQMRATARRGEVANYRVSISVTDRGNSVAPGAEGRGSIAGIQGMDGIRAFDVLRARGFDNVDSFTTGNTLYGIYYFRDHKICVQTTSADNRILDIRQLKDHPQCR